MSYGNLVYFALLTLIVVYILSIIMLAIILVSNDASEWIIKQVDEFFCCCEPFGSDFRVFDWCYDLDSYTTTEPMLLHVDANSNKKFDASCCWYTFIYIIKEILKQISAWIIHFFCCFIFNVIVGFGSSVTYAINTMIDKYPVQRFRYWRWSIRDVAGKPTVRDFLFDCQVKKQVDSKYGSNYLKHITPKKHSLIRLCCLYYHMASRSDNTIKSKSSMFDKYLNEKHQVCFAGVTMKSLKNNSIIDDEYENGDDNQIISVSKAFKGLIQHLGGSKIKANCVACSHMFVIFAPLWCTVRLCVSLLPFVFYISCIINNIRNIDDNKNGTDLRLAFWLQTGLFVWYFCSHCVWIAVLINYIYQFYWYKYYTTLVPYTGNLIYVNYKVLNEQYLRVLTSYVIKKILSEYFDRDVCSLIAFYHDNMDIQ